MTRYHLQAITDVLHLAQRALIAKNYTFETAPDFVLGRIEGVLHELHLLLEERCEH